MFSRRTLLRDATLVTTAIPVNRVVSHFPQGASKHPDPRFETQSASSKQDSSSTGKQSYGQRFDVQDYGAVADGRSDSTRAFQDAVDHLLESGSGHLHFSGQYLINGPIVLAATNLVGIGIQGEGRSSNLIQAAENSPLFTIEAKDAHSLSIDGFNATWASDPSPDHSSRSVIKLGSTGNFYNSHIGNITLSSAHYFIQSEGMLVWGVSFQNIQQTASTGGFYKLNGSSGQPNIRLTSIYVGAQEMRGPIFEGKGINAELSSVEVNQAHFSPTIISDNAGGNYIVGLLGCEGGTWSNEDGILFQLSGSVLLAQHIFLSGDVTEPTTIFRTEGRGYVDVNFLIVAMSPSGKNGKLFLASIGGTDVNNPNLNRGEVKLHRVRAYTDMVPWNTAGDNWLAPVDVGNTDSADAFSITEWNDPTRISYRGNADSLLAAGDTRVNIITTELTEDRTLTLPDGNLMFSGRTFEIVKANSAGSGKLIISTTSGESVTEFGAEEQGRCALVWNRSMSDGPGFDVWTVIDRSNW